MQGKRVGLSVLAIVLMGSGVQADPLYSIKDLTPTGYTGSVAFDINANGDAVGVASRFVSGSVEEAFFFYDHSAGTSTPIGVGTLTPRNTIVGTGFRNIAINDSGEIVGTARFLAGPTETRGFLYSGGTSGTFTNLGTLPGLTATGIRPASDALDINATGFITGTATSGAGTIPTETDNIDVYLNTGPPLTDLDTDTSVATRGDLGRAVNNAGLVVGRSASGKAASFSGATTTELLAVTSEAADSSVAYDLNELGEIAIENSTDSSALIYDTSDSSLTFIPQIGTGNRMSPRGINESGDVVGVGDRGMGLSDEGRGFIYDATTMTSYILEDHIDDLSVPAVSGLGDWEILRTAWAINDLGWIVGDGERRFDGNTFPTDRAYLLIPVPEPASVAVVAALGGLLLRRRQNV
ncbi:MAG: DUF3466 family protein [Planctomycetota bacterium]